jgi:hypothetical protein
MLQVGATGNNNNNNNNNNNKITIRITRNINTLCGKNEKFLMFSQAINAITTEL